jgi:hypothetical protein
LRVLEKYNNKLSNEREKEAKPQVNQGGNGE